VKECRWHEGNNKYSVGYPPRSAAHINKRCSYFALTANTYGNEDARVTDLSSTSKSRGYFGVLQAHWLWGDRPRSLMETNKGGANATTKLAAPPSKVAIIAVVANAGPRTEELTYLE